MIKVRPYAQGDAFKVEVLKDVFHYTDAKQCDDICNSRYTFAHTFFIGDTVIAVLGCSLLWPGVGEYWTLLSEGIKQAPIEFHKLVKRLTDFYIKSLKLRRAYSHVKADYIAGKKWVKSLGYEYEGTMKAWGKCGEDYEIWARVI